MYFEEPLDPEKLQQPVDDEKAAEGMELADLLTESGRKAVIAEAQAVYGETGGVWEKRREHMRHMLNVIERGLDYDLRVMAIRNTSAWHLW